MTFFYLLLGGLATFRLALLFSKESGPGFIFRKLRRLPPKGSSVKEGLSCILCLSVWFAAMITAYEWWLGLIPGLHTPLHCLAMSAIAIFCNQSFTKGPL